MATFGNSFAGGNNPITHEIVATRSEEGIQYFATVQDNPSKIIEAGWRELREPDPTSMSFEESSNTNIIVKSSNGGVTQLKDLSEKQIATVVSSFVGNVVKELNRPDKSWQESSCVGQPWKGNNLGNQGAIATALAKSTVEAMSKDVIENEIKRSGTDTEIIKYFDFLASMDALGDADVIKRGDGDTTVEFGRPAYIAMG
ncbi:hypothetical protein I302_104576 [Kwoniella bestiolae CBS 10118]|uniref:Uncharacterized protein n=1 Tax=Kwoniella bestiolae CBS 10118 TaxID=1296100 RepID=A0A1B9GBM3_9TREE|nr:hypothetical protein I302_03282 [Kwoniella bestiolae CBS 10118]OCF28423.1 hypothetical protein I302_03282 [Kwoniella bestiolae CBS 10118]